MPRKAKPKAAPPAVRRVRAKPATELRKLRAELNEATERAITARVPELLDSLFRLAAGGYPIGEETWEPPVVIDLVPKRKTAKPKPPALVLVKRTAKLAVPDRAACEYLLDRVLGRTKQSVDVSGPDGGPVLIAFAAQLQKIYGDPAPDTGASPP